MLRGQLLLLLLFFRGSLIDASLDTTSFASLDAWKLKDSPQSGPWTGAATDSDTEDEDRLQSSPKKGWCSTWGAGHFSTFDHHEYDFKGMCNYVFTATCGDALPTFSIQLRRGSDGNISRIIMELGASVVTVNKAIVSVRDIGVVSLPYTSNGLQITPYGQSVQLVAKQLELELDVMWGPDPHLAVLVEKKYMGKLCGLCGNFDGEKDNEFLSEDGKLLEPHKYASLQKLDDPSEICAHEAIPSPTNLKTRYAQICNQLLTLVSPGCDVPKEPLVLSCQTDMAECAQPGQQNCSCSTLSEYSRRCSMTGQPVRNWRTPGLCPVSRCPANQVYQECGEVCIKTCSNPRHSCSSSCTVGCFCPHGTLLDDVSRNNSCVPASQCPCMLNGVIYGPGEITRTDCQTCQCTMGRWACTKQPCPGHCSLEGGSFVTTFDDRHYRFHGTCTYTLLQSPQLPNEGTLMAVYDKSGYSHSETSLVSVIYLSKKDKIVISEDEVITNNGDTKLLPYKTHNITIFRQTSTHLQMATTFGLEVVVQLSPVFQVYITVGLQFKGQTRGLCGNFNGDTTDDFTTSMGIDEGTASLFVDSWRAGNCPATLERETDPCSMSQLNKVCAETHCSMLLKKGSVFEKCHAVVNPQPFYKRCVYQACNYEETFPHICSALGAYAHACSSQGILLWGWRSSVDNCTVPCTGNRTFSYDSKACDRTCLSLSDRETECHASAVPVDGCNCPEGTYLNHKAECVHKAQCPCLLDSYKFIQADQSTMINGVICNCINGRLSCPRQAVMFLASCPEPKTFQSCSQSSEDKFGAACAPTCQMLATGIACVPTKCEAGCVCPSGLYENSDGQCVPAEECPCDFAGVSYPGGAELHTDCKICTCSQGRWTCQLSTQCPSTCVLYGEGHIVTFDGQRFVFDGNCEYTLATDDCGANSSQPTFKILTENVVCGKSGVTCSRAIKISLGGLSITMADKDYTVSGEDPLVHLQVKPSLLNLVLDIDIPGRLNMTLVWNKHMSVSIKIRRITQDALCGLCGNSNGNMKDDFETRSKYVASNELEFVNSWKESPLCGDASYVADPCSLNNFRRPWAERKCNIINSQTFAACHSKVYHLPYYEACVRDTCGCDMGGDCECLCDAVAAYAKACLDKGVCVDWRTPDFCPIYCDFYNIHTLVGENEYQYAQEANCTWHYQPCLCPGSLGSFPETNIEGCYNCSQNEYFDHREGTCVPCAPPATTLPPTTTGSQPTTATPISTELHSSSSAATPVGPSYLPGLPTPPPSASSSTEEVTDWTTPKKPTVTSEESLQTTVAITPPTSSPLSPISIPKSTPTRLPVTGATTKPTVSSLSSSTKTTAQFTESTTVTPLTSAMPGMSSSQVTSAKQENHPPATTTSLPTETTELPLSRKTTLTTHQTGQSNSLPPPSTWTQSTVSQTKPTVMTWTTPSELTTAFHNTEHTSSAPSETSIHTMTTFPKTQNSLSSVKPTTSHMTPSPSIINPSTTFQTTTTKEAEITHTSPQNTYTTQAKNSLSTGRTSTSLASHSYTTHHQSTSFHLTTIYITSTMSRPGTPRVSTSTGTNSSLLTPHITHPVPTGSISSVTHTTGPPLETPVQTTITYPTPSGPQTSLSTQLPIFSTLSVTPTTERENTPKTSPHLGSPASTSTPLVTPLTTTIKGTWPPQTSIPVIYTTTAVTLTKSSLSTERTSSHLSETSSGTHQLSTSIPETTLSPKTTTGVTGTPEVHSTSGSPGTPLTPHITLPESTVSVSSATHTTGPPSETPVQTTITYPTPSGPQTSLSTQLPIFSTLSVTPTAETDNTAKTSPHLRSPASTSTPLVTPLTTTIKGTRPPQTSIPVIYTTTAVTQTKSSLSIDRTSSSHLSETSTGTHQPTTLSPKETTGVSGTPEVHSTSPSPITPLTPHITHPESTVSVSSATHTTGPPLETPVQTTITYPTPSGPQNSLSTQLPIFSTLSVTPTTERENTPTSPHLGSPASTSSPLVTPLKTTIKGTRPPQTSIPVIYTTTAATHTKSSLSTDRTSSSHLSETSSGTHQLSTSIPETTLSPKATTGVTGTPEVHSTLPSPSTPLTPHITHPESTVSDSSATHSTGPPLETPVQTTITYPTPSGPQTSLSTQLPIFSTLSVTPTTERENTPKTSPHLGSPASTSMPLVTPLTTSIKGTRPPQTSIPVIYTTTAATHTESSHSTDRTSSSHLSETSSGTHQLSTSIPETYLSTKATTGVTGTPEVHSTSGSPSTPLTPHITHPVSNVSVSSETHTTGTPSETPVQTTITYPTPSGPQTSLSTQLPIFSTLSVTPTTERENTPTSPHLGSPASTSSPLVTPLKTTIKGTRPPQTSIPVIYTTTAATHTKSSLSTDRTSSSHLSETSSGTHQLSTSIPETTLSPKTTTGVTGTPEVHSTSPSPSTTLTPHITHPESTVSDSSATHTTGPPSETPVQTTITYPTPSGPQTSLSTQLPIFSTLSVTPTTERENTPTSPHLGSPATTSTPLVTPLTTTIKGTRPPQTSIPVIYTTTAVTLTKSSLSTDRTSSSHLSETSSGTHQLSTSIPETTLSPKTTTGVSGTPEVHSTSLSPSTSLTAHITHSEPTVSVSSATHNTGPPSETPVQTTITYPTPSGPQTSLSTQLPIFSTLSVTPTTERENTPKTSPHLGSPASTSTPLVTPLTTSIKGTRPPQTSIPVIYTTTAATHTESSHSTDRTSSSHLSETSSGTHQLSTSIPETYLSTKATTGVTGTPEVHSTSGSPSTPLTPHITHPESNVSVSSETHTTGPPSETPVQTTITYPTPSGPQTSLSTQLPIFSTLSVTPTTERENMPKTSPHFGSPASTSTPLVTPLTTTIKGTRPPQTSIPVIYTTTAVTLTKSSLSTDRTSSHLSETSSGTHQLSTSIPETTLSPKATTGVTGTPEVHSTSGSPGTPLTPHITLPESTVSVSSATHTTGPPSETPVQTTITYPTPSGPQTSLSTQLPIFSTLSVTPTAHRENTPTSPHLGSPASTSTPLVTPLTTTIKGTRPPQTSIPVIYTTTAVTQTKTSLSTDRTTSSHLSETSTGTHQPTTLSPKATTGVSGTPEVHSTSPSPSTPLTPHITHAEPNVSVSSATHTTGPPSETPVQTTITYPTPSGPQTSLSTQLPIFSTLSVTPTTERENTPTSPQLGSPASTSTPLVTPLTTTIKGTRPPQTSIPVIYTTTAVTLTKSSLSTDRTSSSHLSEASSGTHHLSTSIPETTLSPKTTTGVSGTPEVHSTSLSPSTPLTPHITHSEPTVSVSSATHTTGPPSEIPVQTTVTYPTPSGPQTSLSTQLPIFSTLSVTPTTERENTPKTSPHLGSPASTSMPLVTPLTTTIKGTRPPQTSIPVIYTTTAVTLTKSSLSTDRTSSSHLSETSSGTHQLSISIPETTLSPKATTGVTGTPEVHSTSGSPGTPLTPHITLPESTVSVSSATHTTGPPSETPVQTTITYPTPSGPQTSLSTQLPIFSTLSVTPTPERENTPTSPHLGSPPSTSSPLVTPLKSTIKGTRPPQTSIPVIYTTTASTHTKSSLSTDRTSSSHLSETSSGTHQLSTSIPESTLSPKATTGVTGTPEFHSTSGSPGTPLTPHITHPESTVSVSSATHTTGPPSETPVQTTITYPTPSGPQTSLSTQPPIFSTLSVTPTAERENTPTSPHLGSPASTSTPLVTPLTTTIKGTRPPQTSIPVIYTTTAVTQTKSSLSTDRTSSSHLSETSTGTHQPTTLSPKATTGVSGTPEVHSTSPSPSTTLTPHITHPESTVSVSSATHTTGPPLETPVQTTITYPTPSGPQTSLSTQLPIFSTLSVTPTTERENTPTSPHLGSPASTSSPLVTPLKTTIKGTRPPQTSIPVIYTTTAATHTKSSLSTDRTSSSHLSETSSGTHQLSTSIPETTLSPKATTGVTGTPEVHSTLPSPSTPLTPHITHPESTVSVSSATHSTGPPLETPVQTTITYPTPSGPQTSLSTQLPIFSTLSVTPTTERENTPKTSPHFGSPASTSMSLVTPLTTSIKGTRPPQTSIPVIYTTTAATHTESSHSTDRTSSSHLSETSSGTHQLSTSIPETYLSTKATTGVTGTPEVHSTSGSPSTPLTPHITHPESNVSVSSETHTTGPPSETPVQTTITYPTPSGPQTSLSTQLPIFSTLSVTPTAQRENTPTSPHLGSPASTSTPLVTPLTTTIKGTRPPQTSISVIYTTTAVTQTKSSLSTDRTSSSHLSETSTGTHQPTTLSPKATTGVSGTPEVHSTSPSPSTPLTPHITHPESTVSVSSATHTTGPPLETPVQTTITYPTPSGPQTSLSTQLPIFSTLSVTPTTERENTPTSPHLGSPASTSSPLVTPPKSTIKGTRPPQTSIPVIYTTTASTHTKSSLSTDRTSSSHLSETSTGTHQPTTLSPKATTGVSGTPEVHSTSPSPSTPLTPHITHAEPNVSVSSATHTTGPPLETPVQTTITYPTPSGPQTSLSTQLPIFSTLSVTPTTERENTPTSPHLGSPASTSTPLVTPLTTTIKGTRPPQTSIPVIYTTTAVTLTKSSLSTDRTSSSHLSETSSGTHQLSTSIPETTLSPKTTTGVSGTPEVHSTSLSPSTPLTPHITHSETTVSVSSATHTTGPPSEIPVQTTITYPTPSGPQTSLSTQLPIFSTLSVTPTTERENTPKTSPHLGSPASTSTPLVTPLTTTIKGTRPPQTSIPVIYTTTAVTLTKSSLSTERTSSSHLSETSSGTHQLSTSIPETTLSPKATTGVSGTPEVHSTSGSPGTPLTPHITLPESTVSVSSATHTTGPPSETPVQTTITYPTPSGPQTSLATAQPGLSTYSVSPTPRTLSTPTSPQTVLSPLTSRPQSTLLQTTIKATESPPISSPGIHSTSATTQVQTSFSTERRSTFHLSETSSGTPQLSTSIPETSLSTKPTMALTGTPMFHTFSGTPSSTHIPNPTHPPPTATVSSTSHSTGHSLQTSVPTPTILATPSGPQTSSVTYLPLFSTFSVIPTSEILSAPTSPHTASSAPTSRTLSTILPTIPIKGTSSPQTAPPATSTTTAITHTHSPFTTAKTSPSEWTPSLPVPHSSTVSLSSSLPPAFSLPTIFPSTSVSLSDVSPSPIVTSPTSSLPNSDLTTSFLHSSASFPPSLWTSSVTPTSSSVGSTLQYIPTPSSVSPPPLFTKHTTEAHPSSVSAFVSSTAATPVNSSVFPVVTSSIPSSALPTIHMTPSPSSRPTSSVSLLATSKTTSHVPMFSSFSSTSTTSLFTSLTTQAPTSGILSSTMGMTVFPSSPNANHTTRPPSTSPLSTSVFLSSPVTPSGSSSPPTPVSPSSPDSWVSSPPTHPGVCSVQEEEQQITYQGCVANVTLTRCQGFCASSVSFNMDTLKLETHCGCCRPLSTYKKQLSLPCPDPNAPGQQLTLTLQVFSSCACSPLQCKD